MSKLNLLIFVIFVALLSACTTVAVKPGEILKVDHPSVITVAEKQQIEVKGFELKNEHIHYFADGQENQLGFNQVEKVVAIDRWKAGRWARNTGLAFVGGAYLYSLATVGIDQWLIIALPPALLFYGAGGYAVGYLIGDRTIYQLTPAHQVRPYASLAPQSSEKILPADDQSPIHFGLNLGVSSGYMPKFNNYVTTNSLNENVNAVFAASLELGYRWSPNLVVSAHASAKTHTTFGDADEAYDRTVFSVGPVVQYFPYRRGVYVKAGLMSASYNESARNAKDPNIEYYSKDYSGFGYMAGFGFAYSVMSNLYLSAEMMGHLYQLAQVKNPKLLEFNVALNWF